MPVRAVRPLLVAVFLLLLGLPAATASAATKVETVDGEVVFAHGQRPGDPGNCSAVVFVQWADVPGTVSAKATYLFQGEEHSEVRAAPFDDTYEWVATYTVSPGSHWIQIGVGWRDGPGVDTCEAMSNKQRELISADGARVELTIEIDPKVCEAAKTKLASRKKAVRQVKAQLRNASTQPAKNRLRSKLARAKTKRAKAIERVGEVC